MSELSLKLPVDLLDRPQFSDLKAALGDAQKALTVWFWLYRTLVYRAKEGYPPGRLSKADHLPGLLDSLKEQFSSAEMFHAVMVDKVKLLRELDGDYFCTAFLLTNADAGKHGSMQSKGAILKNFYHRQKSIETDALMMAMNVAANKWRDAAGNPLEKGEIDRITRLIISCDNALNNPDRMPVLYTPGLIQSALKLIREYSQEQINMVCRKLAGNRHHPRVKELSTEKLLPIFGNVLSEIE